MSEIDEDFQPYGDEWKKEMQKFKKGDLIDLLAKTCIERNKYAEIKGLSPAIPESLEERQALKKAWSESSGLSVVSPAKQEQKGWISVEERLPENANWVCVYIKGYPHGWVGAYADGAWNDEDGEWQTVTHWQPLPALPYTEENPGD